MGAFNAIMYVVLRDLPFAWYGTAMFALVGLTVVAVSGDATGWTTMLRGDAALSLAIYYVALTQFCRTFLSLAMSPRRLDVATFATLGVTIVALVANGYTGRPGPYVDEALQLLLLGLLFARGVLAYRHGYTPARFYLVAFLFAAAGVVAGDVHRGGVPAPSPGFAAGIAVCALLFALGLADRNRALSALIALDGLTGIPNRRSFDGALARAWDRARRSEANLAMLMIDVDHFKRYNDTHGHQAGDESLRQIAQAVREAALRPDDIAARYGGEEFALVLPLAEPDAARIVGERVRHNVRALAIPYPESPSRIVTVSVGVASLRASSHADPSHLVRSADQALYRAKRAGRDRVILATSGTLNS